MLYNSGSGSVVLGGKTMEYVCFGYGEKALIMIPGLSEGLKTVKGTGLGFARSYRIFAGDYRVYMFSRFNEMDEGTTTRDMARDLKLACDELGITSADVLGVSEGGMIAQHLALDYPEFVKKLILAVTASRKYPVMEECIPQWIKMADNDDYSGIMTDTAMRSYSEAFLKKYGRFLPLLTVSGKPKSFSRFIIQANACLTHNAYDRLGEIKCPVLILGGSVDKIVGPQASYDIAEKIPGSVLYMYEGQSHAPYQEEEADFNSRVLEFIK